MAVGEAEPPAEPPRRREHKGLPPGKRFAILRRDHFTCRYCGRRAPDTELHVDHVHPKSAGGTDDPENLVTACADCNGGKSASPAPPGIAPEWQTLIGRYFHTFSGEPPRRFIARQGRVVSDLGDGYYVVEYASWFHGGPEFYGTRVVPLSTMAAEGWAFYASLEAMADAYAHGGGAPRWADSPPTKQVVVTDLFGRPWYERLLGAFRDGWEWAQAWGR